jgi:hypothetical protein
VAWSPYRGYGIVQTVILPIELPGLRGIQANEIYFKGVDMSVSVDIADRLYDYTDEEKAAEAVSAFQVENGLSDEEIVALWDAEADPRRGELERRIFDAVDANGSARRAQESVPVGVALFVEAA